MQLAVHGRSVPLLVRGLGLAAGAREAPRVIATLAVRNDPEPRLRVPGQMIDISVVELAKLRVEVPGLGVGICPRIRWHTLEVTLDLQRSQLQVVGNRTRGTVISMATESDKITVALDAAIVADVRRVVVDPSVATDAAVVERALNAYLLGRIVDTTQARSNIAAADAERIACDELRAARRESADGGESQGPEGSSRAVSAAELARAMRERNAPRREAVLRHVAALRRLAERVRGSRR